MIQSGKLLFKSLISSSLPIGENMSKNYTKRAPSPPLEEREGTILASNTMVFSKIPEALIDTCVATTKDDGTPVTRYTFNLLRWARDNTQLFDSDVVTFVTIKELKNGWHKGNFVILRHVEYKEGDKITMAKHPRFGWQPK